MTLHVVWRFRTSRRARALSHLAVAPSTDPNLLYDTRHALDEYGALWPEEIKTVVALLLVGDSVNHGRVHAALAPAIDPSRTLPRAESFAVGHGGWEDRGGEVEGFV